MATPFTPSVQSTLDQGNIATRKPQAPTQTQSQTPTGGNSGVYQEMFKTKRKHEPKTNMKSKTEKKSKKDKSPRLRRSRAGCNVHSKGLWRWTFPLKIIGLGPSLYLSFISLVESVFLSRMLFLVRLFQFSFSNFVESTRVRVNFHQVFRYSIKRFQF